VTSDTEFKLLKIGDSVGLTTDNNRIALVVGPAVSAQSTDLREDTMKALVGVTIALVLSSSYGNAQNFIVGADVSSLRQLEGNGVVLKDAGKPEPGLRILKNHGYTWVRLRVTVDPANEAKLLASTIAEAKDAKKLGFNILLDFDYSDGESHTNRQAVPQVWASKSHPELVKAVFEYTRDTTSAMKKANVTPDMVQIGNAVTGGMMWPDARLPYHWKEFAELLHAGIKGVEEGSRWSKRPQIMIHIDQGGNQAQTQWFFDNLAEHHVEFDVIGQTYYPSWQKNLGDLKKNIEFIHTTYHKDVIVVETAYEWRGDDANAKQQAPYPETPEGQREFLATLKQVASESPGCKGIFWMAPATEGTVAKRALFDDDHNALPAIHVFDQVTTISKSGNGSSSGGGY
jgi:arabinogalactan endo-1,4-beta-galactosidase